MLTSKRDLAKYPFTKEAVEYVKMLDLKIDEFAGPEYLEVIDRAEQRILEALEDGIIRWNRPKKDDVEIISFPIAILLVSIIGDDFLKRRYALAEAKRAEELLGIENEEEFLDVIRSSLNWSVKKRTIKSSYIRYALSFVDYLRHAPKLQDDDWKLVNQTVTEGDVLLRRDELIRLIREEVQERVQRTIEDSPKIELPAAFIHRIERLSQIVTQRRDSIRLEELPKVTISAAFPPCIKRMYDALLAGQHLSHIARFTLTSFLLTLGMSPEELTKLYTSISDFSETLTRYQVEHIAGKKGSGTKYTPPRCDTLRTHSLCIGADDTCNRIRHPLSYYRRKIRLMKTIGENQKNR